MDPILTVRIFQPKSDTLIMTEAISNRGCKVTDQIFITTNEPPSVSITGQTYYCVGGSTQIMVNDGLISYDWSDGNRDPIRTVNNSGTYTVVGTDANGCSNQASIIIEQNELPQPVITGSKTYCPGSSTELSINQQYVSQQWNFDGDISLMPTVDISQNGTIFLEVTDEFGCTGSTSEQIVSNPDLSPIIAGSTTICENTTGVLDAGNGFDNYIWSNGATTSAIEIAAADNYSVTVSTNDGCSGTTNIDVSIVPNPTVAIQGVPAYCTGESEILFVDNFQEILWSDGSIKDSITVNNPGPLSVQVKDIYGCVAEDEVIIQELSLPDARINGDSEFCEGDSTRLEFFSTTGDAISTVEWSNGSRSNSIFVKETSSPTVFIEDRFGCKNSATIQVIKNLNPVPNIIYPEKICEGSEIKIYTDQSFNTYLWNNEVQTDSHYISNSGSYEVLVTDVNGCQGSDNIIIEGSVPPIIEFKSNLIFCNTQIEDRNEPLSIDLDTIFSSKNIHGEWSSASAELDLSNLPIINFEGTNPGTYELIYTSIDAVAPCNNISRSIFLEVLDCQCPNVRFQSITPLCSLSDALDLSTIQSSDFEGSWQVVEGPSSILPNLSENVFNAINQMPGAYRLEFRLIDGIAPLGCAQAKSVNVEVAPHIDASIELVNPACGGQDATFRINLSGGDTYDVDINQSDGEIIRLENIADGYTFSIPFSGQTALSFNDIQSDLPSCGFEPTQETYIFQPSDLDAQVDLITKYGDYGVSCADAVDGGVAVNVQSGIAPFSYSWSNGASTDQVMGLSAGTYGVTVLDDIGCEFTSTIVIDAPPAKQLEITPENPECGQGPGRLFLNKINGIPDGQWELYLDDILLTETQIPSIVTDLLPGTHVLEAINNQGCMESHTFNIQDDSAYAIHTEDISVMLGQSDVIQANFDFEYKTIQWSPSIYLIDSTSQSVFVQTPLNSTLYTITVRDINDCIFQETVRVNVLKDRSLAVPTGFTPNGDSNNDVFIVHSKSDVVAINNITVFDRWGESVFNAENIEPNTPIPWDWTFRNQPLPKDQYVWKATASFIDGAEVEFSGKFYIIR